MLVNQSLSDNREGLFLYIKTKKEGDKPLLETADKGRLTQILNTILFKYLQYCA